jgi:hypothetical protein
MFEDDERARARTSRWSFSGPRHDHLEIIEASFGNWMAQLPDDLPLAFVSMPGTHNSASFAITRQLATVVSASRCQACDLEAQFTMGIRFLDLRVRPDGQLCHGPVSCEFSLREALQACSRFLSAHPSEVILTRIKDEGGRESSARGVDALVHDLVDSAEFPVYLQMRLPALREVRGRIVILCDWAGGQLGVQWGGEAMRIQDQYWHRTGTKKWAVVKSHLGSCGPLQDCLQVNFTSSTALPRKTPLMLARSVNPKLSDHIRSVPGRRFLGVVVMDFPSALLCDIIIRYNFAGLDPCRSVCSLMQCGPKCREWLDNLGCELMAAATRADALELMKPEELKPGVQWLARVFIKLLVERTCAETDEPAILENAADLSNSNAMVAPVEIAPIEVAPSVAAAPGQQQMVTVKAPIDLQARSPKQSLLERVGQRLRRRRRRTGSTPTQAPCAKEQSPKTGFFIPADRSKEFALIDNLECELIAAATNADAAALARPEELSQRVQWLSRVCVRLAISRVQARLTLGGSSEAVDASEEQAELASSSEESPDSAPGEDLPCSEPEDLPSRQGTCEHISAFMQDADVRGGLQSEPPSPVVAPRSWGARVLRYWGGGDRPS